MFPSPTPRKKSFSPLHQTANNGHSRAEFEPLFFLEALLFKKRQHHMPVKNSSSNFLGVLLSSVV